MIADQKSRVLAAWEAGILSDAHVIDRAEGALLALDDPAQIPTWLVDLVERGPRGCCESPGFGSPARLDYWSEFSLRAASLDLASDDAVAGFAEWAARSCIGEDLDDTLVQIGYYLDHLVNDCRRSDWAVAHVREALPGVIESCRARATHLLDASAPPTD